MVRRQVNVGPNDPIHLAAHVASPALGPFSNRWLIYNTGPREEQWLVTTIGYDDDGGGFSTQHNDLQITAAGQRFEPGCSVGCPSLSSRGSYDGHLPGKVAAGRRSGWSHSQQQLIRSAGSVTAKSGLDGLGVPVTEDIE